MKMIFTKKKKGMTLVEVMVALAVFTIMSWVLVTCCMWVNKCTLKTNSLLKNISYQTPIADRSEDADMNRTTLEDDDYQLNYKSTTGTAVKTVVVKQYIVNKATDNEDAVGRFKYFVYEPASSSSSST